MEIKIGVKTLIETVCRRGGLTPNGILGTTSADGLRLQRKFTNKADSYFPNYEINKEVQLLLNFTDTDPAITINGRADIILQPSDQSSPAEVVEIKSFNGNRNQIDRAGYPLHWFQALLYTCMLHNVRANGVRNFNYHLAYISDNISEPLILTRTITETEAFNWLHETINAYCDHNRNQNLYIEKRNLSIKDLKFPYSNLRSGQKKLMSEVLTAISQRVPILAQAPTGTGKTISVVYPSIKAIAHNFAGKIFYLTAKVSTREVVETAVKLLLKNGLLLRSITLTPKEQLCPCPEIFCDTNICPYAIKYYDFLPEAINKLKIFNHVTAPDILAVAKEFSVCPFELSLDFAVYCDLIIGDYNHFFDPKIRLSRFFNDENQHHVLLIDEAHNLVERTLAMFSAELSFMEIYAAKKAVNDYSPDLYSKLNILSDYFSKLAKALKENEAGFDLVEKKLGDQRIFQADNFRAVQSNLPGLNRFLHSIVIDLSNLLNSIEDHNSKKPILDFYFSLLFFLRVQDEFWADDYLACFKRSGNDLTLTLKCQDTSAKLVALYKDLHTPIFFSATLTPMNYFRNIFCGNNGMVDPLKLELSSPFPAENLLLINYTNLKTTFKYRNYTAIEAAKLILGVTSVKTGNYLVYFPSYNYLNTIYPLLNRSIPNLRILRQTPNMDEKARSEFLAAFAEPATKSGTIGLAILGGIFGEGIDLVGERLNGVIIIGVGLPQLSPERELLRQYYDFKIHQGFNFSYLYPGFNKVMQAAGRLIRSENDVGFIILADERYEKPDYRNILPDVWKPITTNDLATTINLVADFFQP